MRVTGIATTVVVLVGGVFAAVVAIVSIPDIKRYLAIRRM